MKEELTDKMHNKMLEGVGPNQEQVLNAITAATLVTDLRDTKYLEYLQELYSIDDIELIKEQYRKFKK